MLIETLFNYALALCVMIGLVVIVKTLLFFRKKKKTHGLSHYIYFSHMSIFNSKTEKETVFKQNQNRMTMIIVFLSCLLLLVLIFIYVLK